MFGFGRKRKAQSAGNSSSGGTGAELGVPSTAVGRDAAEARLGDARRIGVAWKVHKHGMTRQQNSQILNDAICGDAGDSLVFAEIEGPGFLRVSKREIMSSNVKETNGSPTYRFYHADLPGSNNLMVYVDELDLAFQIQMADGS